nr:MAG TPA: hypothetical protein [Caudoviricetes sp.]
MRAEQGRTSYRGRCKSSACITIARRGIRRCLIHSNKTKAV